MHLLGTKGRHCHPEGGAALSSVPRLWFTSLGFRAGPVPLHFPSNTNPAPLFQFQLEANSTLLAPDPTDVWLLACVQLWLGISTHRVQGGGSEITQDNELSSCSIPKRGPSCHLPPCEPTVSHVFPPKVCLCHNSLPPDPLSPPSPPSLPLTQQPKLDASHLCSAYLPEASCQRWPQL